MFRPLKTSQLAVDVSVAAVFFLVAVPFEVMLQAWSDVEARFGLPVAALLGGLVAAVFSTALALRRAAPALALGIAWAGALLQLALSRPPSFSDLAIFAVLYTTAAYGSRAVSWAGLASTAVGALVITVYLFAGPLGADGGLRWSTLPLALVTLVAAGFALGLAWTIGALVRMALRARENRAAQERAEAEAVAEAERVRIARDMHDVVAHSLAVIIAQSDGARYAAATDPDAAPAALGTIAATARSALTDVRLLLAQLRSPHARAAATAAPDAPSYGPQPTIDDLDRLYAHVRAAGVDLSVDVDPAPAAPPPAAVQLAVYRILQEALTNALRHGDGGRVDVRLAWYPVRVDLVVTNGVGVAADAPRQGHGLIGMRERAQLVGGTFHAAVDGGVFVVRAILPIGAAA